MCVRHVLFLENSNIVEPRDTVATSHDKLVSLIITALGSHSKTIRKTRQNVTFWWVLDLCGVQVGVVWWHIFIITFPCQWPGRTRYSLVNHRNLWPLATNSKCSFIYSCLIRNGTKGTHSFFKVMFIIFSVRNNTNKIITFRPILYPAIVSIV